MLYSRVFQNHFLELSIGIGTVAIASLVTFHFITKPRKISRIIDTMDVFNKESVHIKNRDHVEEIVSQLIKGSASKLQIISDFDQTLSRIHKNGKQCGTTYGIFKQSPLASDEYKKKKNYTPVISCNFAGYVIPVDLKSMGLFNHYHPIEVDPRLTKEEKEPYMIEWYTKSRNLMPSSGITKDCLPSVVEKSDILLRDGCEALFESLCKQDVPLLIFSAGIGDVLKEVLQQSGLLYPNIKIIANFMQFDEQNKLTGFKGDLIHTFNKDLSSIENKDYFNHLKSRNNVILLGDSLGDLDMAAGAEDVNVLLKIGFLNFKVEENLPKYLEAFDIVLCDDQTMDVVIGLLQHIL